MRVFPFIRMTLHGDSWYKRPGLYRFVFRGVPVIARAFSDMKYDLGNPAQWPERYDIAFAPDSTPRGAGAAPDAQGAGDGALAGRRAGPGARAHPQGDLDARRRRRITLVQTYAPVAGHAFVARQTATISLPRMKADLEAEYADFNTTEASVGSAPQ